MSKLFDAVIGKTLHHEGGFVNDPDDPGGATNFGISIRFLKSSPRYDTSGFLVGDLDHDGDIDISDMRQMTREEAVSIYREYFWDKFGYDRLIDENLAFQVFDMTVNAGAKIAQKLVQRSLHAVGKPVAIDGILGNQSYGAIASVSSDALVAAYKSERAGFYRQISTSNPKLRKFLKGWLRRAYGHESYDYEH